MMESNENDLRRSADQEFIESLNQLENILQQSQTEQVNKQEAKPIPDHASIVETVASPDENEDSNEIDLAAWEDAVADIEQYLERQTKQE